MTEIRVLVPLNDFLPTGTMLMVPGLRSILICWVALNPRTIGKIVPEMNGMPRPGVMPRVLMDSMSSWVMPQPI